MDIGLTGTSKSSQLISAHLILLNLKSASSSRCPCGSDDLDLSTVHWQKQMIVSSNIAHIIYILVLNCEFAHGCSRSATLHHRPNTAVTH